MLTIIDPHHKNNLSIEYIREACGILPGFIDPGDPRPMQEQMIERYGETAGGVCPEITGGTVSTDGIYEYPGDPTLYPLMEIYRNNECVWIYHYGLVTFSSGFVTRMD